MTITLSFTSCLRFDLEHRRRSLPHPTADRGEPERSTAPAHLERGGADESRSGGADRMAERTGAAVRIDARSVEEAELLHPGDRRACERLVHLDDAHAIEREVRTLE